MKLLISGKTKTKNKNKKSKKNLLNKIICFLTGHKDTSYTKIDNFFIKRYVYCGRCKRMGEDG